MHKTAFVADSNSGITQEEAKALGCYILPMPFIINGREYLEGVDLTHEEFFRLQQGGADITTSQPAMNTITELWDSLLKDYESIVHIPMSSSLSGSCQTAILLSEEYDGKVQVVNNQRISVTQRQSLIDGMKLAESGYDAKTIKEKLEADKFNSSIYIMMDTLEYLKKGGRITPAAAALGTLLRIKPVLQIQGEKLDSFAKVRTLGAAKAAMINACRSDMVERFSGSPCTLHVGYTCDREQAHAFAGEVSDSFAGAGEVFTAILPMSICCHIGYGAIATAITKNMDYT